MKMAHPLGELMLLMMISASFGQEPVPLLADFIDFLYTTTLNPRSCGVQKQCVPFYSCKVIDSDDTICGYPDACCGISDKITLPTTRPEQHEACGYRNVGSHLSGSESDFGEFPWLAALMSGKEAAPGNFFCSAAIIAPTAVLTTAFCVRSPTQDMIVQAGEWLRMDKNKIQHRARRITKVIKHEKFDESRLTYNVALVLVDKPFEWEENVRPVCLPESNITFQETGCYVPSWTKDKPHVSGTQAILKRVDSPVVPTDQCLAKFRPYVSDSFQFHETTICAGGKERKDYDIYNSAVPLVCSMPGAEDRYFLAGMESFLQKEKDLKNNKYAAPGTPRANVNVPLLRPWITEKLAENGINLKPPVVSEEITTKCGYRNVGSNSSGSESDFGEFPWLAALMSGKEAAPGNFFCSAVIIAPTAVLTTAYCVRTPTENLFVQVGEWLRMDKNKIQLRARRVEKVIKHENFDETYLTYNLALVIVDRPFQWEENVRPVCLPKSDISFSESPCYAPSWTKDKPHVSGSQAILKRVDSPVVPTDQCLAKFRPYVSESFKFHETTICAGGKERKDYDIYNSAVPLVCSMPEEEDRYFLAGMESFIQKEKDLKDNKYVAPGTPRANVNVALLRQWITEKLAENGIDMSLST